MRPLLIVSLGNPAPLTNTLHSAGHLLNTTLATYTSSPPFAPDRRYAKGLTSSNSLENVTFWQSPWSMNISGQPAAAAWRAFCSDHAPAASPSEPSDGQGRGEPGPQRDRPHLVVLHDELELDVGRYKVSTGKSMSPRGHNGLKSLLAQREFGKLEFSRVGVGIGPRPVSRRADDVAEFVLGRIGKRERDSIEGIAADVWAKIVRLRDV